jgi:hypothetical protein
MNFGSPAEPVVDRSFSTLSIASRDGILHLLMIRNLLFKITLVALALSGAYHVHAQAPDADAVHSEKPEPLQMIIDYGQGVQKRRECVHGVMEPVGVPTGQEVGITLRFLRPRAGTLVTVSTMDGGQIDLDGPVAIADDGSVFFHFSAGLTTGLYRLTVDGTWHYEIPLYAVNPSRPGQP